MQNVARRQNRAAKNRSVEDEYNAETREVPHLTGQRWPQSSPRATDKPLAATIFTHRFSHERRIHDFAVLA